MFFKSTIRVSFIQGFITVSHIVFGLSLAYYFGASPEMDAYVVAANFIIFLNTLFVKAQTKTLIPYISKYKDENIRKNIIASIVRFNIIIFALFSIIIFAFSNWIAIALAPGLSSTQHQLSSNILKILSLFILLSNFCGIGVGLIEFDLKFEKSALITFIQSILIVLFLFAGVHYLGIYSIPVAHILALVLVSSIYLYLYFKGGNRFKTTLKVYNDYIKKYIHLLLPIILASLFIWLIRFADMFIASFFDIGSISYLNYCQRIITYVSIVSNTICTIYFPLLSKLNNEKDNIEFTRLFYKGLQTLFSIALSVSIFAVLFAEPIITILFERGKFTSADTEMVSTLLTFYSLVLLCSPLGTYLANAYFCRQQPKTATLFSIISSVVNIILNCIFGFLYGIIGLAFASSISFLLGNILQISNIRRVNPEYRLTQSLKALQFPFVAGIINLGIFYFLKEHVVQVGGANVVSIITGLLAYALSFFGFFFILCYVFRVEIAREIVNKFKLKFQK